VGAARETASASPRDTRRPLMTPASLGEGREGRTGPRVTTTLSRGRPGWTMSSWGPPFISGLTARSRIRRARRARDSLAITLASPWPAIGRERSLRRVRLAGSQPRAGRPRSWQPAARRQAARPGASFNRHQPASCQGTSGSASFHHGRARPGRLSHLARPGLDYQECGTN